MAIMHTTTTRMVGTIMAVTMDTNTAGTITARTLMVITATAWSGRT